MIATPSARSLLTRSSLEAMLLDFLKAYPHCQEATSVSVRRIEGAPDGEANWIVTDCNPGRALQEECDKALALIVPIVQLHFDLAPEG